MPNDVAKAAALNWMEVPLQGDSAHEFGEQLRGMDKELVDGWQVKANEKSGNPMYVRPSVMVLFREDHRFLLDDVIPKRGQAAGGDYDLILASQPWRARMSADFKVKHVLAPLAKSLRPGGRLLTAQSCGDDPGLELVRKIWPDEDPFKVDRHELIKTLKEYLGRTVRKSTTSMPAPMPSHCCVTTCIPCPPKLAKRSVPRPCSPRGMRRFMSARSKTSASNRWYRRANILTPPPIFYISITVSGSTTKPLSYLKKEARHLTVSGLLKVIQTRTWLARERFFGVMCRDQPVELTPCDVLIMVLQ